ncbi:MAG: peptidylprolyl isomerase [Rikenellaceae bacterium]|nr:peptidylprolyl isomerase [Rikenellaceae bacterium]
MFRNVLAAALLTLTFISGIRPASAQEKFTVDKVVAVVGNSPILYSDIEEVVEQYAMERRQYGITSDRDPKIEALELLLEQKLLYNQALIDSIEINKAYAIEEAEERVGNMVASAGSVAALEEHFHSPIFEIKRIITNRLEEQNYAQEMRREISRKVTITPGEVEKFYKKQHKDSLPIVPIQYVYSQITRYPVSTKEAKLRAREQLLGLRERIINEGTRFDVLARMYSEDGSAAMGGELEPMTLEEFEQPFARGLEKLRPGQVSEVVETIYGFHIIQLIEKNGQRYRARHILIRPQFTGDELIATNKYLDSLAGVIRADSITFEKAALEHSEDKFSKYNGGLVSNLEMMESNPYYYSASDATTKHYKEMLPPDDFRALEKLQPGEISPAFQTTDGKLNKISKIVKLLEIIPSHPANLKEDYLELEKMALNEKTNAEYLKWLDKKIGGMFIRIDPEYRRHEEFENKSWLK